MAAKLMTQSRLQKDYHPRKNRVGVEPKKTISYQIEIELGGVTLTSPWFDDTWENIEQRVDRIREDIASKQINIITNRLG